MSPKLCKACVVKPTWHHTLETAEVDDSLHSKEKFVSCCTGELVLASKRLCLHLATAHAFFHMQSPSSVGPSNGFCCQWILVGRNGDLRPCQGGQRPRLHTPPPCPGCTSCLHRHRWPITHEITLTGKPLCQAPHTVKGITNGLPASLLSQTDVLTEGRTRQYLPPDLFFCSRDKA